MKKIINTVWSILCKSLPTQLIICFSWLRISTSIVHHRNTLVVGVGISHDHLKEYVSKRLTLEGSRPSQPHQRTKYNVVSFGKINLVYYNWGSKYLFKQAKWGKIRNILWLMLLLLGRSEVNCWNINKASLIFKNTISETNQF